MTELSKNAKIGKCNQSQVRRKLALLMKLEDCNGRRDAFNDGGSGKKMKGRRSENLKRIN